MTRSNCFVPSLTSFEERLNLSPVVLSVPASAPAPATYSGTHILYQDVSIPSAAGASSDLDIWRNNYGSGG